MKQAYVEIRVEGVHVPRVLKLHGTEGLSTLFRYEVEVELELPLPAIDAVIGAEARLTMRDNAGRERVVTGVIAQAEARAFDNHRGRGHLVLRPVVWRQSLGRDCYAMQDVTVRDMVDEVLEDYTGQYRWELTRSYPRYHYRVQYREDDWTYVSRVLEQEGIFYWFDHEERSMLVMGDKSTAAPDMAGGAILPWVRESAMRPDLDAVTQMGSDSAASTGRFAARSFDLERPTVTIQAKAGAGRHEVYDAPGGGTNMTSILEAQVNDQREANIAAHAGVSGLAKSVRPTPGRVTEVEGHPLGRLDGRYLVTRVEVEGDDHRPCHTRFDAIRLDVPFRPLRKTPEPKQAGLQMGHVIGPDGQEVHPDELARVRCILWWDRAGHRDERGGTWMRVAQRATPGSMLFPRMGWNVATFNEEGAVDAPSVIWRIHDGEHVPEYSLPGNMTRVVWKTATSPSNGTANEIHFEDKHGLERMLMNASRDMNYKVNDSRHEVVGGDSTITIGGNHDLKVGAAFDEQTTGDQEVSIDGNESWTIDGSRTKTVGGNETETINGKRSLKVGKSNLCSVHDDRTLTVTGSLEETTENNINLTSKNSTVTVKGSVLKKSDTDISEVARKDSEQEIGGFKVEVANKDRGLIVRRDLKEEVHGSVVGLSNKTYIDHADTNATWQVVAALMGLAPEVHVEAIDLIRFKSGDSVLTLTKQEITLTGPKLDLSGAALDATSAMIKHNV